MSDASTAGPASHVRAAVACLLRAFGATGDVQARRAILTSARAVGRLAARAGRAGPDADADLEDLLGLADAVLVDLANGAARTFGDAIDLHRRSRLRRRQPAIL